MKKLIFFEAIIFAGILCCIPSCTRFADNRSERMLTVIGTSTVYAAPDKVSISFAAISRDKNLSEAKQKNDSAIKKVNQIFTKYKIEQKNITIGRLNIDSHYSYRNEPPEFMYYEIHQRISVSLENVENYESFLTDLLNAGIDRIYDVEFSVQDIKKYKNDARVAAVKAAEEKAALLCVAADNGGKKLAPGTIIRITEIPQQNFGIGYAANQSMSLEKNAVSDVAGGITPIGQIQITAQVEIVFALENK